MRDWCVVWPDCIDFQATAIRRHIVLGGQYTANIKLRPTYRRLGNGEYRIEATSLIGGTCYSPIIVLGKTIKLYFVIK